MEGGLFPEESLRRMGSHRYHLWRGPQVFGTGTMPELPEVESLRRYLIPEGVPARTIISVEAKRREKIKAPSARIWLGPPLYWKCCARVRKPGVVMARQ